MKKLLGIALILWATNAAANETRTHLLLGDDKKPAGYECSNAVKKGNLVASTFIDGYRPMSYMAYDGFLYKIIIEDNFVICLRKQRLE